MISANTEWDACLGVLKEQGRSPAQIHMSPFGEWAVIPIEADEIIFLHGGWGKIAAAASTQYAIDNWKPQLLINLGTCGGFPGEVDRGDIILAERTVVYDIIEQMGDFDQAIADYSTTIDLAWISPSLPSGFKRGILVSADRDLVPQEVQRLRQSYGAVAGDWESGAVSWTAARNHTPCLILRGVTDLVEPHGSDVYGNIDLFARRTGEIMSKLVASLPDWLAMKN